MTSPKARGKGFGETANDDDASITTLDGRYVLDVTIDPEQETVTLIIADRETYVQPCGGVILLPRNAAELSEQLRTAAGEA